MISVFKNFFKQLRVNTSSCFLLIPGFLMAIMPWGLEDSFNFNLFGYDISMFMLIGYIVLLFKKKKRNESFIVFSLIFAFLSALVCFKGDIIGRYFIGIEFIMGYLFAREIKYNDDISSIIRFGSILLLIAILFQQVSLSLGLGFIESGQETVELTDGVLRVGTSVGSSTLTGIFIVLILAIILQTSKSILFDYIAFFLGAASVLFSGTRSAMLVLFIMAVMMLFGEKYKMSKIVKIIFIVVCLIYVLPFVQTIFEARNEVAGDSSDITSGRVERWEQAFVVFRENPLNFIFGAGPATVPISMFNEEIKSIASPHNVYIGILLEYGVIYTIAFLVFMLKKIMKQFSLHNMTFVVLLTSMLVTWNTEVVPLNFLYSFFFWMLYHLNAYKIEYETRIYQQS